MRIIQPVDIRFWIDIARRSKEATFFHSPLWHRLVLATFPSFRDASLAAEGGGIRAVLPLVETGRTVKGFFRVLESTFASTYGGLIADGPLEAEQQLAIYHELLSRRRIGRIDITGNPLAENAADPDDIETREDFTRLVLLSSGYDDVASRFSEENRNTIEAARDAGVVVRQAWTLDDYQAYYELYTGGVRPRSGSPGSGLPWALFENGFYLSEEHPHHVKLWLAEQGDRLVAGAWVFYWNWHAAFWHGVSGAPSGENRPSNLLHDTIIQDACARGFRYYDVNPIALPGEDPARESGVTLFESRFGAERRRVPRHSFSERMFRGATPGARSDSH